jgi:hypothetical protein
VPDCRAKVQEIHLYHDEFGSVIDVQYVDRDGNAHPLHELVHVLKMDMHWENRRRNDEVTLTIRVKLVTHEGVKHWASLSSEPVAV